MPRVVQLVAVAVVVGSVSVAVSAPVPKELKVTPPRLLLQFGGPTLDPKKMEWGINFTVEWEWPKDKAEAEKGGGIRLKKWQVSSPFPVFDEPTLLAKGTPNPNAGRPKGWKAVKLSSDAEHLLLATKLKDMAASWEGNGLFGFSPQPGEGGAATVSRSGFHRLSATMELYASKTKQFDLAFDDQQPPNLLVGGPTTTRAHTGSVNIFLAESPTDGSTHTSVNCNLGGGMVRLNPNSVRLEPKGKFTQGSAQGTPLKLGNGYECEWRVEYTGGGR